jgi:Skp family chaperone for outer membrane proteins
VSDNARAAADAQRATAEQQEADRKALGERLEAERKAREELNQQMQEVMDTSQPTLTQTENDAVKTGIMRPEDKKEDRAAPEMPPLAEQQRRIAEASGGAPYQTREATRQPPPRPGAPTAPTPPPSSARSVPRPDDKKD